MCLRTKKNIVNYAISFGTLTEMSCSSFEVSPNIFMTIINAHVSFLLDLKQAFDTVDHEILLFLFTHVVSLDQVFIYCNYFYNDYLF